MKQTEVGLIPDDWEVKSLNDIGKFIGGGTPNTNNANYWKGNIPWISSADISKDSINTLIPTRFITKEAISCSATKLCPKNTILIVSRVGVGKLAISNTEVCTSQDFTNLVCNNNVDESFVAYQLLPELQKKASEAQGTSIKGITTEEIRSLQIPFPLLAEQQRIAKALSDLESLISTTEKLLQKKKNIKQGAMQNLLTGKKRLPGFAKSTRTKMTELGEIPEDWEVLSFDELFDICTETISVDSIKKESYIGIENMLQDKMGVIKNETVLNYLKVREYRKQDILVSNIRPYLKKIWFADKNGGCSTDVLVFRKKRNSDNADFLFKIVSDDRFFNIVNDNAVGTKMPRGDKNIIKHVLFAIPTTKEEQTAIANVLSSMDKEIETLNTKLEKYRNLKTAMMQQLLTGKIRLK